MTSLYVLEQGSQLGLTGEQLVVYRQGGLVQQVPLPLLDRVLIFGRSHLTLDATRACLKRGICVAYLSRQGWLYGSLRPLARGMGRLWSLQKVLASDDIRSLDLARTLVAAKIHNQRVLLQRLGRRRLVEENGFAIEVLEYLERRAAQATDLQALLGFEGAAAAQYFPALGRQITHGEFLLTHRVRRPPTNPMNALLSFGYSLLWNHLRALVELSSLDPYQGHLHVERSDHLALVSDLIEPFRAPIVDALVLMLVNTRVLSLECFEYKEGACLLNDRGRRLVIEQFERRMGESIQLPSGKEGLRWELVDFYVQAYRAVVYDPSREFVVHRAR
ncbi:CRISPR-associated endonuclease Cas1 [Anthocerotibacter panamensis]|uniref:CRISPR-associated endonuclease Cas1 n=1 Tax=Anthocerotibacter panamensis TaxID=2857077 RepID=UPI001C405394|nr:CRISPR-associated endonuclease Cas1 [Anthocerotibacter panamensis]